MKVFLLIGESAAGKTEIFNQVVAINKKVKPVISTTSRLPRVGEIEGVDYNFISYDEFSNNLDEFLEHREYRKKDGTILLYGTHKDAFKKDDTYIHVVDGKGFDNIEKYFKDKGYPAHTVISIFIHASDDIRLDRSMSRENVDDEIKQEIMRRLEADSYEIRPYRDKCCISLRNNTLKDLDTAVQVIDNMINAMSIN